MLIVDPLEVIDVDHEDSDGRAAMPQALEEPARQVHEGPAIVGPGQRVGRRQLLQGTPLVLEVRRAPSQLLELMLLVERAERELHELLELVQQVTLRVAVLVLLGVEDADRPEDLPIWPEDRPAHVRNHAELDVRVVGPIGIGQRVRHEETIAALHDGLAVEPRVELRPLGRFEGIPLTP